MSSAVGRDVRLKGLCIHSVNNGFYNLNSEISTCLVIVDRILKNVTGRRENGQQEERTLRPDVCPCVGALKVSKVPTSSTAHREENDKRLTRSRQRRLLPETIGTFQKCFLCRVAVSLYPCTQTGLFENTQQM